VSEKSSTFRTIRIAVLLTVLIFVIGLAYSHHRRVEERRSWQRTLHVGVWLAQAQDGVDPNTILELRDSVVDLELALNREFERYGGSIQPFRFHAFGPVLAPTPPTLDDDSFQARVQFTWELRTYTKAVRLGVAQVPTDIDIYVSLRPPSGKQRHFEGIAALNSTIGLVEVELEADMIPVVLMTVAHELFHTLGATDKYDSNGETRIPDGLGDPDQEPLFPQAGMDVMGRDVVLGPGQPRLLRNLSELRVNRFTAAEIGWDID